VRTRFGQFILDSETRQLLCDGAEIHLSPKAFDLLCALIGRRPNVVPKADLFKHIWPNTFVVDANLNVLIGEIRRALDDDRHTSRFIRTVHGVGYAFCYDAAELKSAAPASDDTSKTRCWLVWKDRTFVLSPGDNIIGRDPQCNIWLDHSGVSRLHARIRIPGGTESAFLDDLESTNGTFVRHQRVLAQTELVDGDAIKVGSLILKFRAWSSEEKSAGTKRIRGKAR
jgi:DNA-binding winged helix-turn-helix (wHTH) protein